MSWSKRRRTSASPNPRPTRKAKPVLELESGSEQHSESMDDDEEEENTHEERDFFVEHLNKTYQSMVQLTEDTKNFVNNQCKTMKEQLIPMQKCIQTLATLKYENEVLKQQLQEREKEIQETEMIRSLMKQLEIMQSQLQKRYTLQQPDQQEDETVAAGTGTQMEIDVAEGETSKHITPHLAMALEAGKETEIVDKSVAFDHSEAPSEHPALPTSATSASKIMSLEQELTKQQEEETVQFSDTVHSLLIGFTSSN